MCLCAIKGFRGRGIRKERERERVVVALLLKFTNIAQTLHIYAHTHATHAHSPRIVAMSV